MFPKRWFMHLVIILFQQSCNKFPTGIAMKNLLTFMAILLFSIGCRRNALPPAVEFKKGRKYESAGYIDSALTCYRNAIVSDGMYMPAQRAAHYWLRKKPCNKDSLIDVCIRNIREYPDEVGWHILHARMYPYTDSLRQTLLNLCKRFPKESEIWLYLGNICMKMEFKHDALSAYDKALALDSTNARVLCAIGHYYYQSDKLELALKSALSALRYDNLIRSNLGSIYLKMYFNAIDKEEAADSIECKMKGLLKIYPDNTYLLNSAHLLACRLKKKHWSAILSKRLEEKAPRGGWAETQAIYPQGVSGREHYYKMCQYLGDYPFGRHRGVAFTCAFVYAAKRRSVSDEEACCIARDWIREYPASGHVYKQTIWDCFVKHRKNIAYAFYLIRCGISAAPVGERGIAYFQLAKLHYHQCRNDSVSYYLNLAKKLMPANADFLYWQGKCQLALGHTNEALILLSKAAHLEETTAIRRTLERAYEKKNGSLKGLEEYLKSNIAVNSLKACGPLLPQMDVSLVNGENINLADYGGRVLLLNFWKPG